MPQNIAPPSLISLLAAALVQQPTKPLVLALDRRCGSGKTTLANTLARQFPASITLHTDDFYQMCIRDSRSAPRSKDSNFLLITGLSPFLLFLHHCQTDAHIRR